MKYTTMKAVILIALSLLSQSVFSGQTLSAAEIKHLFNNKTVTAYSEIKKAPVSLFYDENGEVRGLFTNGKLGATKWWVKDIGQICLKSKNGDLCFEVIGADNQYQKYLIKGDGTRVLAFSMETFSNGNSNQY